MFLLFCITYLLYYRYITYKDLDLIDIVYMHNKDSLYSCIKREARRVACL